MFRYVYSVLLLAVTKPACDHIIRMITKSTYTKVDESTASVLAQLQRHKDLIEKLIEQLQRKLDLELGGLSEDVVQLRSLLDADIRKLLLENRAAAHDDALSLHDEHVQMYQAKTVGRLTADNVRVLSQPPSRGISRASSIASR